MEENLLFYLAYFLLDPIISKYLKVMNHFNVLPPSCSTKAIILGYVNSMTPMKRNYID